MNILTIRQALRTGSIFDIKLTVTFYARVSSDSDEQINSLGNQIKYYTDFIKKNPKFHFLYVLVFLRVSLSKMVTLPIIRALSNTFIA